MRKPRHKPHRKRTQQRVLGCLSHKWRSTGWEAYGTPGSTAPHAELAQRASYDENGRLGEATEDPFADPGRPVPNLQCADRFEAYYKAQWLVDEGREWVRFIRTLHQPLPVTFRVQPHGSLGAECRASLAALLEALEAEAAQTGATLPEMHELRWCSSWSVAISKDALKASRESLHVQLQAWLTKWAALGAVNRQAIESMVPVCLLAVEPHHAVLDMCASPGSKTTQALEALYAHSNSLPDGDGSRAAVTSAPTRHSPAQPSKGVRDGVPRASSRVPSGGGFMVANDMVCCTHRLRLASALPRTTSES